jgi:hypothetical protein
MPALPAALDNVSWRVSKRCVDGGCVMVGRQAESILVGNTMQPNGPYIIYTNATWKKFLLGVKRGDFDRPPDDNSSGPSSERYQAGHCAD